MGLVSVRAWFAQPEGSRRLRSAECDDTPVSNPRFLPRRVAEGTLSPLRARAIRPTLPRVSLRSTPGYLLASLRDAPQRLHRERRKNRGGSGLRTLKHERMRWLSIDRFARSCCRMAVTTTRLITILVAALWLAGCASRSQQSTTRTDPAPPPPPVAPPPLFQTTTIIIRRTNPAVYIDGEVRLSARFDWNPEMTLTNLIALAGGFTDFANRTRLEIRRSDGTVERYSYPRILKGSTNNPSLKHNDHVYVPRRIF